MRTTSLTLRVVLQRLDALAIFPYHGSARFSARVKLFVSDVQEMEFQFA